MFCYQCEQTAFNKGCTTQGVCGKKSNTSDLQDELINNTIKLAICSRFEDETTKLIVDSLFITITNVNYDDEFIKKQTLKIKNKLESLKENCDFNFKIQSIFDNTDNIKSLKSLVLFGLKGIAAYYHHCMVLNYFNKTIEKFFYQALNEITQDKPLDCFIVLVLKTGEINLKCMELLDRAHSETFGNPIPTEVTTKIEKGPFIVISGHDLLDLKLLLEQTKNKGINVYTHGEMLPSHGYPELKKYPHLKGNFGTAWQNQKKEFDNIPAPVLFTTNCIMSPNENYIDRIFTTSIVAYPNTIHIKNKDFTPIINKALELKGYDKDVTITGINGGEKLITGFGHNSVTNHLSKIIKLIKEGKIKHIFLIGGCDGAKTGRNYYTEFVKMTPSDTLILTLACGKYRFNDIDLGNIEGIPRILDMGQCNDAYSAIIIAKKLSEAFNMEINELPLSFILSWYEQKAVCILLTLLYLEIKNIKLGPSLPAFISQEILDFLVKKFKISPITNPKEDLEKCLSK